MGSRVSLFSGLAVITISVIIGTLVGALAGYFGGWIDEVLMRATDLLLTIPSLILAMTVAAALGTGVFNMIIAISITWWPAYARLVRGEVISKKEEQCVVAARALGASWPRILGKHILPNIVSPIVVKASLDMGFAILTVASLGFVGIGVKAPTPEWEHCFRRRESSCRLLVDCTLPGFCNLPGCSRLQPSRRRPPGCA